MDVKELKDINNIDELLAAVRLEAMGWTWAEACSQLDRNQDPRNFEVPKLVDLAKKDLNF